MQNTTADIREPRIIHGGRAEALSFALFEACLSRTSHGMATMQDSYQFAPRVGAFGESAGVFRFHQTVACARLLETVPARHAVPGASVAHRRLPHDGHMREVQT